MKSSVALVCLDASKLLHHIHASQDSVEYRVLACSLSKHSVGANDEELAPIAVGPGTGHEQNASTRALNSAPWQSHPQTWAWCHHASRSQLQRPHTHRGTRETTLTMRFKISPPSHAVSALYVNRVPIYRLTPSSGPRGITSCSITSLMTLWRLTWSK